MCSLFGFDVLSHCFHYVLLNLNFTFFVQSFCGNRLTVLRFRESDVFTFHSVLFVHVVDDYYVTCRQALGLGS